MARRRVEVIMSDLTGKEVSDPDQVGTLRVLDHPILDHPVVLDAFVLELANLKETKKELVSVEVVLPGEEPQRMLLELKDFDRLITQGNVDDVLLSAQRYEESGNTPPTTGRRRGRPPAAHGTNRPSKKSSGSGRSMEELQAIRDWAKSNGHDVSPRGRIAAPVLAAFDEAHKASS